MTCKDCIKEDVCYKKPVHKLDIELNELGGCSSFQNKADFVEVVRCGKCTRSVNYEGRIMCNKFGHKFQGEWYGLRATTKDHFCGHGTRK